MRLEIVNGPSLEAIQVAGADIKVGRTASVGMTMRDEEGHEFKIFGEPEMIYRVGDDGPEVLNRHPRPTNERTFRPMGAKGVNAATFVIDIKHANVGGRDKDCPAAKAFQKRVRDVIYNANAGTGYVNLDI